jgi:hypothetical protein
VKKVLYLVFILFSIIAFIWSQYIGLTLNPQVLPKTLTESPVQGSWTLDKYVSISESTIDDKTIKDLIGKTVHFSKDTVNFNGKISKSPKYKVKSVDAKSYFWNIIKVRAKTLGISNVNVQIITINSNDAFFDEYIKLDELTLLKSYEGFLLYFHKTKDLNSSLPPGKKEEKSTKISISKDESDIKSKSGLLLGLKYENPKVDSNQSKYLYKTIWISSINGKFLPILQTKDLLLPRQNGFWKVGINKTIDKGISKDVLWAYPLNPLKINSKQIKYSPAEDSIIIQFLGSDYISIDTNSQNTYPNSKLKILPMDNLLGDGVKLSSISGSLTDNSILPGTLLNNSATTQTEKDRISDTNWGVIRRSGRWILRGRMENNFDISYATPKALTTYDDLFPSFNIIKEKIPNAVDAYSSPNRDFVVVLTTTELLVFPIRGNTLGESSLNLEFKSGETSVMAHWATGSYVYDWEKKLK